MVLRFFCAEKVCFRRMGHIFFCRMVKRVVPMGEKAGSDRNRLLSDLTGEQGQDALRMLERMERLRRLMGNAAGPERQEKPLPLPEKKEAPPLFAGSVGENMIAAAIPFLDQEYQKDLYIIVRLMEMQRVFSGGLLEARGKQEEPAALRRRKMLRAVRPYLPAEEKRQLDMLIKAMDMKEILEREGGK